MMSNPVTFDNKVFQDIVVKLKEYDEQMTQLRALNRELTDMVSELREENEWLEEQLEEIVPPKISGFQWALDAVKRFAESLA